MNVPLCSSTTLLTLSSTQPIPFWFIDVLSIRLPHDLAAVKSRFCLVVTATCRLLGPHRCNCTCRCSTRGPRCSIRAPAATRQRKGPPTGRPTKPASARTARQPWAQSNPTPRPRVHTTSQTGHAPHHYGNTPHANTGWAQQLAWYLLWARSERE